MKKYNTESPEKKFISPTGKMEKHLEIHDSQIFREVQDALNNIIYKIEKKLKKENFNDS